MLWRLCVCAVLCVAGTRADNEKPNIIIIVADDLGFNDVGFHGSNQIPTPNIDALAYSGIVLQNFYVTPLCTPSRAALMTGKYPIHTGMQHGVIYGAEPRGLPLTEKIMPEYFKDLEYNTHLVGKWHLGHYKKEYLPLSRGFDSHLGTWTGKIDLYDHINMEKGYWGRDFKRGIEDAADFFGQYATDVYTEEAIRIIQSHNQTDPLFLMVCHNAVQSGNSYEFLRAPENLVLEFSNIRNFQRRKYAAMVSKLDESVGRVISALKRQNMLENSIILFTSDNGGPAAGFNDNAASNYPLRGVKNTLFEGGVRSAALLWGGASARVAPQRAHLVDVLPTLYSAAGGNPRDLINLDGIDLWKPLSKNRGSPKRKDIVHNIDDVGGTAGITSGKWKIIKGLNTYGGSWSRWYGPSGRYGEYNIDLVYKSAAGVALSKIDKMPSKEQVIIIRDEATLKCDMTIPIVPCSPLKAPCLFNMDTDPCERQNLAEKLPDVLKTMLKKLGKVNMTAVPPNNEPLNPKANPKYWGNAYTNFGDF